MKPLRICLVSKEYPPEGKGGIVNYVHFLAHGLAEKGHDVIVTAGPAAKVSATPSSHTSTQAPK